MQLVTLVREYGNPVTFRFTRPNVVVMVNEEDYFEDVSEEMGIVFPVSVVSDIRKSWEAWQDHHPIDDPWNVCFRVERRKEGVHCRYNVQAL